MKKRSVVIIGAGIGGITAAIHLAQRGIQVTIVEKNAGPGGRCDRLDREGHHFDTGPTLFVMPLLYKAEFRALGINMHEHLDLLRVDPTYNLVFDDGSLFALTSDVHYMREQLEVFQPGSFQGFLRYLQEGGRHYQIVVNELVNHDFRSPNDIFNLQMVSLIIRLKSLINHYRSMKGYFDSPRLKSAFTFQDIYMGLSPFKAPATFSMMPFTELVHGVWYPRGGMYRIVEALSGLACQAGVEFRFSTEVEKIDTDSSHAQAVLLNGGSRLTADVFLANADLPYVYKDLLPRDKYVKALAHKRLSCSVISFFWGLDKQYPHLGPHTLFLAENLRENFERIELNLSMSSNPSLYLHAPSRLDPSMAPEGHDTLVAIVPVGHISDKCDQDWGLIRDQARQQVFKWLRNLGITDLESHIKFEETYTPPTWVKRYNLVKGATHGLSHELSQMACLRPSNRHPYYQNLYFVGASTHPGTGIPTAMVSGRLVAQRIYEEQL